MTGKERILAALMQARGPVCDDCLSDRANVRPRQQVNGICNPMGAANLIVRRPDTCVVCHKLKLSSRTQAGTEITGPVVRPAAQAVAEAPLPVREPTPPLASEVTRNAVPGRAWHWEGRIQSALARHLLSQGWEIRALADTESKEPGIDIVATKDGRWLAVEVKGYPSTTYERGPRRGEAKPTSPSSQARQWFSHALLSMMLLRHKRPDAEIAACFPDFKTFRRLASGTRACFELLGFGVYYVGQDGRVALDVPHRAVDAKGSPVDPVRSARVS